MSTKEHLELLTKAGIEVPAMEMVASNMVQKLIDALYRPHLELKYVRDPQRCKDLEVDEEPINWGSLYVNEVYPYNDGFKVVIDEAAPDACPTFCAYIEKYMSKWGWVVYVETEW